MRSCYEHVKMPTWGISNASVLLNEHWHPLFYFKIEVSDFFRLLLSNCLNWKINCDDHSSLSSSTAVQI